MRGWSESPCIFGFESFLTFVARSKPGEEKEGIAKRPALKILTSWKWWWNLKERGEVPRFPVLILQRFHQGPPPGRPQSPDVNASSLQIKTCKQSNQWKQFMGRSCLHIWVSYSTLFIGPESDHWLCLSLTHWLTDSLTHCRLVDLIDVTLLCEDAYSKLVEVVTVADEDRVGNMFVADL